MCDKGFRKRIRWPALAWLIAVLMLVSLSSTGCDKANTGRYAIFSNRAIPLGSSVTDSSGIDGNKKIARKRTLPFFKPKVASKTPLGPAGDPPAMRPDVRLVTPTAVAVLMYHRVNDNATFKNETEKSLTLPVKDFISQLDWLSANGYHVVRLDDAYAGMVYGKPLPEKPVVLTFDDGAPDAFTNVFPTLHARRISGTFFVKAGEVDKGLGLNWDKVMKMTDDGMQIESHTVTHADLPTKSPQQLIYELTESKLLIERHTRRDVQFIAYPYGRFDQRVIDATKKAGYVAAWTTQQGVWRSKDNLFALKRVRMYREDPLTSLASRLSASMGTTPTAEAHTDTTNTAHQFRDSVR